MTTTSIVAKISSAPDEGDSLKSAGISAMAEALKALREPADHLFDHEPFWAFIAECDKLDLNAEAEALLVIALELFEVEDRVRNSEAVGVRPLKSDLDLKRRLGGEADRLAATFAHIKKGSEDLHPLGAILLKIEALHPNTTAVSSALRASMKTTPPDPWGFRDAVAGEDLGAESGRLLGLAYQMAELVEVIRAEPDNGEAAAELETLAKEAGVSHYVPTLVAAEPDEPDPATEPVRRPLKGAIK